MLHSYCMRFANLHWLGCGKISSLFYILFFYSCPKEEVYFRVLYAWENYWICCILLFAQSFLHILWRFGILCLYHLMHSKWVIMKLLFLLQEGLERTLNDLNITSVVRVSALVISYSLVINFMNNSRAQSFLFSCLFALVNHNGWWVDIFAPLKTVGWHFAFALVVWFIMICLLGFVPLCLSMKMRGGIGRNLLVLSYISHIWAFWFVFMFLKCSFWVFRIFPTAKFYNLMWLCCVLCLMSECPVILSLGYFYAGSIMNAVLY